MRAATPSRTDLETRQEHRGDKTKVRANFATAAPSMTFAVDMVRRKIKLAATMPYGTPKGAINIIDCFKKNAGLDV